MRLDNKGSKVEGNKLYITLVCNNVISSNDVLNNCVNFKLECLFGCTKICVKSKNVAGRMCLITIHDFISLKGPINT